MFIIIGAHETSGVTQSRLELAFREHRVALLRYAMRLVGDAQLAADLVQEAFLRLATGGTHIREPRAYLFTIVMNLARAEWRRQQRGLAILSDDPVAEMDQSDQIAIRLAVLGLPGRERLVVWLHYFADLRIADIVQMTGLPEGTVKSLLYDGRRRLARAISLDPHRK